MAGKSSARADLVANQVELVWLICYTLPNKVIVKRGNEFLAKFREMITNDYLGNQFYMAVYFLFGIYYFLYHICYIIFLLLFHSTYLLICFTFLNN